MAPAQTRWIPALTRMPNRFHAEGRAHGDWRGARALVGLGLIALVFAGCRGQSADVDARLGPEVIASRPQTTADGARIIHRMTRDCFESARAVHRDSMVFGPRAMVVSMAGAAPSASNSERVQRGESSLVIHPGLSPITLNVVLGVYADEYNELRIRMRTDRGATATLSWATDVQPSLAFARGHTFPIFADNEFRTYSIKLGGLNTETWVGRIRSMAFSPTDAPARVEIESIELAFVPPDSPNRITIAAQTHEALIGPQRPWELELPPKARFRTYVGLPQETWEGKRAASARFVITLDAPSVEGRMLFEKTLEPKTVEADRGWQAIDVDLSEYSGQRVRIHLDSRDAKEPGASVACWGNPMVFGGDKPSSAVPVVLVSCDTLRADHLSCYGYARETSPHLDQLAREGVLFENAVAPETWTLPSHATMFTGLYPKHHRVTPNANLAESAITISEALQTAGYHTGGFIGFTFWLYPWRGFAHGFDIYSTPDWRFRSIFETHAAARAWLDGLSTPNVFLFLHNFDVHAKPAKQYDGLPYGPDDETYLHFTKEFPDPPTFERPGRSVVDAEAFLLAVNAGEFTMTEEEAAYCRALYDDCIRMIDHGLHEIFERLKELGLYESALIIVTADHGEELGEHGQYGHGSVFEPSLRVPLIIKFPRGAHAGTRYAPVVSLVDLYPTILDVAGLPLEQQVDGQSLADLLDGSAEPRPYAFGQRFKWRTARATEWKLVRAPNNAYQLFNVKEDPMERLDRAAEHPDRVLQMKTALEEFFATSAEGWHFAFDSRDDEWRGDLSISSDDAIESAELLGGVDATTLKKTDRGVELRMGGKIKADELIVRTVGGTGRIYASISAKSDVAVLVGDDPPAIDRRFQRVLDPSERAFAEPAANKPGAGDRPVVRIWYVPQSGGRSAARELTQEEKDELRSIGYVDE